MANMPIFTERSRKYAFKSKRKRTYEAFSPGRLPLMQGRMRLRMHGTAILLTARFASRLDVRQILGKSRAYNALLRDFNADSRLYSFMVLRLARADTVYRHRVQHHQDRHSCCARSGRAFRHSPSGLVCSTRTRGRHAVRRTLQIYKINLRNLNSRGIYLGNFLLVLIISSNTKFVLV